MDLAEWFTVKILFRHCKNKFLNEHFVYNRAISTIPYTKTDVPEFKFKVGPREYRAEYHQVYDEIMCHIKRSEDYWEVDRFILDRKELYESIVNRGLND